MCCIKRNCEAVYDGFFTVWPPCDMGVFLLLVLVTFIRDDLKFWRPVLLLCENK